MWEYKDFKIEVNNMGQFTSRKDDFEVSTDTLEQAKAVIDAGVKGGGKHSLALPVIGILVRDSFKLGETRSGEIVHATLTGINRTSRVLTFSGLPSNYRMDNVCADSPANLEILRSYQAAKKQYDDAGAALKKIEIDFRCGYGRIELSKYGEMLDALAEEHKASLKGIKSGK